MTSLEKLEDMGSLRAITYFSLPSIISLVLESLTGIIDTIFAGNIKGMSESALSAMGALNPVMTMLVAIQLLFGLSTGILVSRSFGEKNRKKAKYVFKIGYFLTLVVSVAVSFLIFIFKDPLILFLGATGDSFLLAKRYLSIAVISNVFSSLGYMFVNVIRAIGYPKMEVTICTFCTIISVVLNFIFTLILNLGITGIALATLISEVVYFLWALYYISKKNFYYNMRDLNIKENKNLSHSLLTIGFVQFLLQAMLSLTGGIANYYLVYYGSSVDLAVKAVLFSILSLIIMPLSGLSNGVQNILSFFIARGNNKKAKEIIKTSLIISFIYGSLSYIFIILYPKAIISIFTISTEIIYLSSKIIPLFLIFFPVSGIFYILITFMQVSRREFSAMKLTILKQIVFIPLVIILPIIFSNVNYSITPAQSIFLSTPLSEIIIIILCVFYFNKIHKKKIC